MAQDMPPIASVFNDAYAAEQFERYRQNPTSVEESWRQFFRFAEEAMGRGPSSSAGGDDYARIVAGAARYTTAIRYYGHMAVQLDPLGSAPPGAPEQKQIRVATRRMEKIRKRVAIAYSPPIR